MKLNVYVNELMKQVDVPNDMLQEAQAIYAKIDQDLDQGRQMSREWVDSLDTLQRCKVVADRLLTAIENNNEPSTMLMAGYIMTRMPNVKTVHIATDGDINQTQFV
ncbi:MAG: hypothetical protein P8019_13775 [Gammaproteobacteria bacterium]|jgi:hypothetical protein